MKRSEKIVFIGIYVAIAIVLDIIKEFIPFLNMPSGGSINIALIPIVLASFHLGWKDGLLAGFMWWLVSSLIGINPYYISIFQYLLDYVIPSSIIGIASILYKNNKTIMMEAGIILAMVLRSISIIVSGAIYWAGEASGTIEAWTISLAYNLPYSIATCVLLMISIPLIYKRLSRFMLR